MKKFKEKKENEKKEEEEEKNIKKFSQAKYLKFCYKYPLIIVLGKNKNTF